MWWSVSSVYAPCASSAEPFLTPQWGEWRARRGCVPWFQDWLPLSHTVIEDSCWGPMRLQGHGGAWHRVCVNWLWLLILQVENPLPQGRWEPLCKRDISVEMLVSHRPAY